jgi:L-asparaginase/Glu-tRNA(Gln) amidotransferase subunit D
MRNDAVYNLVECFSLISEASTINDVLIVLNSKGLRANRCIKVRECSFENVHSPNLPVICSFNENLVQCSKNLILPKPKLEFSLFTELSNKVKLMKLNKYECIESLAYDLKNPFVKGIVIQSYSFANIPKFPEMLKLFKEAFEDEKRRIIFINVS